MSTTKIKSLGVLGLAIIFSLGITLRAQADGCCGGDSDAVADEAALDENLEVGADRFFKIQQTDNGFKTSEISADDARDVAADARDEIVADRETNILSLKPECTTQGTAMSGARKSCRSGWSEVTCPTGFVFNKDTLRKTCRSCAGSENDIDHQWDNYVEIIPGSNIKMPRTLRVRVHARSGRCRGCRGWTKATVTAEYVKYN